MSPLWRYFFPTAHIFSFEQDDYIHTIDTVFQEQFLIMKPKETTTRAFKLYPATDQAAKYVCAGKMRDGSDG